MSLFKDTEIEQLEKRIQDLESKIDKCNSKCGANNCTLCACELNQPDKFKDSRTFKVLHQE